MRVPAPAAWLRHGETKNFLQQQHMEGDAARGTLQVAHPEHGGRMCDAGARPRTSLAAGVGLAG